jgi:hypothetical protein
MPVALVHLSDIHLGIHSNSIRSKLSALAAAVCSTDPMCDEYIFILSGDVASTGVAAEYKVAAEVLGELRCHITSHNRKATVRFYPVPGNHDCFLPESDSNLRDALINAIAPSLPTLKPDPAILAELLRRQDAYWQFCETFLGADKAATARLFSSHSVPVGPGHFQLNLYNTAFLSKRHEEQGELLVPIELVRSLSAVDPTCALSISVFHHPYVWLHADIAVAFRSHIEQTSDVVLTGHLHVDYAYSQEPVTGGRILYSEGDVLQEPDNPKHSGFRIILLNLQDALRRVVLYGWVENRYSMKHDTGWAELSRSAVRLDLPRPTAEFLSYLSNNGIGLVHRSKGPLPLDSVFVYPDATTRKLSEPEHERTISGTDLLGYLLQHQRVLIQGSALSGKTSLAKTITKDWLCSQALYPLLLSGADLTRPGEPAFEHWIRSQTSRAYGPGQVEVYRQLPPTSKAAIIDDWDASELSVRERETVLSRLTAHFGKVILIVGGLSYIDHLLAKIEGRDLLVDFELLILGEMSHVARGKLIDRWLGLEIARESKEFSRRVEETERLIQSVIGRNTLPSLPFIVLSLLQASQRSGDVLPENGAFGYLYEVLITAALNITEGGNKPQLDKKYEILPLFAFRLFSSAAEMLSAVEINALIEAYAKEYRVKIDKAAILEDLLFARVLEVTEGNYSFAYDHYFYYFLARYFKTHLSGSDGPALRSQLKTIANGLNARTNNIFLMFVIYLTHDRELIDYLLDIGSSIFSELRQSDLTEVEFYNSKAHSGISRSVPEEVDLDTSRKQRRRAADERDERRDERETNSKMLDAAGPGYSRDLPLSTKLDYARSCMEILGQVLRNFTGSLPGDTKLALLTTTYRLGLRTLRATLEVLSDADARAKAEIEKRDRSKAEDRRFIKTLERLLTMIGQAVGSTVFREISLNIGSPEIDEGAYTEALEIVGKSHATALIDISIKLDNADSYPYNELRELHHELKNNRFAITVLRDLVIVNMYIFDIGREMRQRVLALFKEDADETLLSRTTKRLR